jgi:hypothetical protein
MFISKSSTEDFRKIDKEKLNEIKKKNSEKNIFNKIKLIIENSEKEINLNNREIDLKVLKIFEEEFLKINKNVIKIDISNNMLGKFIK